MDLTGEPPEEVLLFRAGTNRSYKGDLLFDDAAATLVVADAKDHGADFFFDYDHLSLYPMSRDAGEAAAWFNVEVREGALWAVNIRWTDDGAEKVRTRKYRYISPAVDYDFKSYRIMRLINVALTNLPASHGLPPLMAASQKEETMLEGALAHIAEALGLDPEKATEEELIAAFDDKIGDDDAPESEKEEAGEALAQLRALTGKKTDKEALAAAVAELSAARDGDIEREINDLVEKGITSRRIPAENREAYIRLGKKDIDALRDLVGTAAPAPKNDKDKPAAKPPAKKPSPPTGRHEQASLSGRSPRLSEHDLSVARTLGLDPAALRAVDD